MYVLCYFENIKLVKLYNTEGPFSIFSPNHQKLSDASDEGPKKLLLHHLGV